ncbi:Gp138 family membrane-puncturing spike protein [Breznakiellaceae bacterium SP9]
MQDLTDFMREFIEYYFTQIHTSFPGVVTEYDAKKRRATVQPSLKRKAGNKEFIAFPLLIDVPVQFPATKKWIIHFPP